ncbi:MAG: hypothetical protein JSW61_05730 [Candidatus Thorarchaeota archaeon]|nr:MAG: hypothetical protein JSW61_05730 [Candidatus Thorarchaeota archaeon]
MPEKPFGSGYFGEWIGDEFGLPAYRYTCDQVRDSKAATQVNEEWRPSTDHLHQVGNDRFVAVASNYGHVQLRQDEGSPKFLNDYDPARSQFGGGIGYLTDGEVVVSTFYNDQVESFDRVFGIGYFRKTVKAHGLVVDQIVFAPFGDDPLVISQVTIKNERSQSVDLKWVEYWGCQLYQFSFRSFIMSFAQDKSTSEIRREFSRRFDHKFELFANCRGLINSKRFKGRTLSDRATWKGVNAYLATKGKHLTGGPVKPPIKETVLEDESPPTTFLVSLDAPAIGVSTNAIEFFGAGGVESPDRIKETLPLEITSHKSETGMFLQRGMSLGPGEEKTIYFAYGYLPESYELESLVTKYEQNLVNLLAESCNRWKRSRIHLLIDGEDWVERELAWHSYYLRSNLTFDAFFNEHILSQGHLYQYLIGIQAAARDPLQHALPFVFTDPDIVKNIIRYTLKTVSPEGEIPYGIVGSGLYMPSPWKPSDQQLWLFWLVSEYVLANRDTDFLDEILPTYPIYGRKAGKASVRELLTRCFRYFVDKIGTGKHGLMRLARGDWNDVVVIGHVKDEQRDEVAEVGESILNSSMATYVLDHYSRLLGFVGDDLLAKESLEFADGQRDAVTKQWTGNWFRRAWLGSEIGWVGTDIMWLEPQPWSIIGNAADDEQKGTLLQVIGEKAQRFSKHGATILSTPLDQVPGGPGVGTNAGVWPSINGTLVWALALMDGSKAWEEWKRNTLAFHADSYPEVWYGIWSGPDTYNSEFSDSPGQTIQIGERTGVRDAAEDSGLEDEGFLGVGWTDFPVFNMHPHAWPLYTTAKMLGIEFNIEGLEISPSLPHQKYEFNSPLLDFEKSETGYKGKYAPMVRGTWKVVINLGEEETGRLSTAVVNGMEQEIIKEEDRVIITGTSAPEEPLTWELKY